jgi:hypothetical protein
MTKRINYQTMDGSMTSQLVFGMMMRRMTRLSGGEVSR